MKIHIPARTVLFWAVCLLFSHRIDAVAAITAISVHELTHLTVLWAGGGRAIALTVTPLGLTIERSGLLSHWGECVLSLSAPLCNLLLALLYWHWELAEWAVAANLGYGLLNLLPIVPLDGGKALEALLSVRLCESFTQRIMGTVSAVTLFLLWLFAIAVALVLDGNLSLLFFCAGLFGQQMTPAPSNK